VLFPNIWWLIEFALQYPFLYHNKKNAQECTMSRLWDKEKSQCEQIRRLEEEVATSTKRIAELTARRNAAVSVAHAAAVGLRKIVADNFIPELPSVDKGQEINMILVQVDNLVVDLLQASREADETLTSINIEPPMDILWEGVSFEDDVWWVSC